MDDDDEAVDAPQGGGRLSASELRIDEMSFKPASRLHRPVAAAVGLVVAAFIGFLLAPAIGHREARERTSQVTSTTVKEPATTTTTAPTTTTATTTTTTPVPAVTVAAPDEGPPPTNAPAPADRSSPPTVDTVPPAPPETAPPTALPQTVFVIGNDDERSDTAGNVPGESRFWRYPRSDPGGASEEGWTKQSGAQGTYFLADPCGGRYVQYVIDAIPEGTYAVEAYIPPVSGLGIAYFGRTEIDQSQTGWVYVYDMPAYVGYDENTHLVVQQFTSSSDCTRATSFDDIRLTLR